MAPPCPSHHAICTHTPVQSTAKQSRDYCHCILPYCLFLWEQLFGLYFVKSSYWLDELNVSLNMLHNCEGSAWQPGQSHHPSQEARSRAAGNKGRSRRGDTNHVLGCGGRYPVGWAWRRRSVSALRALAVFQCRDANTILLNSLDTICVLLSYNTSRCVNLTLNSVANTVVIHFCF